MLIRSLDNGRELFLNKAPARILVATAPLWASPADFDEGGIFTKRFGSLLGIAFSSAWLLGSSFKNIVVPLVAQMPNLRSMPADALLMQIQRAQRELFDTGMYIGLLIIALLAAGGWLFDFALRRITACFGSCGGKAPKLGWYLCGPIIAVLILSLLIQLAPFVIRALHHPQNIEMDTDQYRTVAPFFVLVIVAFYWLAQRFKNMADDAAGIWIWGTRRKSLLVLSAKLLVLLALPFALPPMLPGMVAALSIPLRLLH